MISTFAKAGVLEDNGQVTPSIQYPGDDCCWVYEWSRLKGTKQLLCHDGSATTIELADLDNKISSYYCGKSIWYNFCKDSGGECSGSRISSGAGHTKNHMLADGFGDSISSVKIGPYDANVMGAVTMFHNWDCHESSARVYWNPEDPDGGQYILDDLKLMGFENDTISSIQVPRGYTALLYNDNGFVAEVGRI